MKIFHRHRWVETSRRFNPPPAFKSMSNLAQHLILSVFYGITVVELRCACTEIKTVEFVGDSGGEGHVNGTTVTWSYDQPEHTEPGLYIVRLDRREGRARQVVQVLGRHRVPRSPGRPSPMTEEVRARIIRERLEEGMTMEAICEGLTRDRVPTAKGGPWRPSTLQTVIKRHQREGDRNGHPE